MTEKTTEEIKAAGAGSKLIGFGIITVIWLGAAFYLGWTAHGVPTEQNCSGTYSCLTANEWGDFLAGVFAPVAFFWLLAAVWVQSDELREQRTELQATRAVMTLQAEEAKKQATFIGQQTGFIQKTQNDDEFRMKLKTFRQLVTSSFGYRDKQLNMNGVWDGNWNEHGYLNKDLPEDNESAFLEIMQRLSVAILKLGEGNNSVWSDMLRLKGTKAMPPLQSSLRSIVSDYPKLGPAMQNLIHASRAVAIMEQLEPLVQQIESQSQV